MGEHEAPSLTPTPKVRNGGVAGAVTVIAVWVLHRFAHVDAPVEVAAALAVVVGSGTSYLTHP